MAFLYEELAPERKRELSTHLKSCAACATQVRTWRSSMKELAQWVLPTARKRPRQWVPVVKWTAAAALVLGVGFAVGRMASPTGAELAGLKARVAQLEQNGQRPGGGNGSDTVQVATAAANSEAQRLLADYARLNEEQRATDRQQVNFVLRAMDLHVSKLRSELETVAMNTENGFEQTHENLTRLVALAPPTDGSTSQ
jgi:hypothetical protein